MQAFSSHIGSLREIASAKDANLNDRLLLRIDSSRRNGKAVLIRTTDDAHQILSTLTESGSGNYVERVARLIGSQEDEVISRLSERGDRWLADALQATQQR